jgi:cytochrome P450
MIAARDAEGRPFTDAVIFGNAMTMLLAGEDTTAYALAWAVHHLCDTPGAVTRLRAEADTHAGPGSVAGEIEVSNRLAWAGAVANEAMRLRPVAPLLFLEAMEDVVVGDLAVPVRAWLTLLTRPPAVDGRHFVDPHAFRPERWIEDERPAGPHDPSAHIPFGSGPRICPGRTLALLEMKMVLAMLYGSFDVQRVGDAGDTKELFEFTMSPTQLNVRLHSRAARA